MLGICCQSYFFKCVNMAMAFISDWRGHELWIAHMVFISLFKESMTYILHAEYSISSSVVIFCSSISQRDQPV